MLRRNSINNPLAELPVQTQRLYSALEVFRCTYSSREKPIWFQAPKRDVLLKKIGFSKTDIDIGIKKLVQSNLLQIQKQQNVRWYRLK